MPKLTSTAFRGRRGHLQHDEYPPSRLPTSRVQFISNARHCRYFSILQVQKHMQHFFPRFACAFQSTLPRSSFDAECDVVWRANWSRCALHATRLRHALVRIGRDLRDTWTLREGGSRGRLYASSCHWQHQHPASERYWVWCSHRLELLDAGEVSLAPKLRLGLMLTACRRQCFCNEQFNVKACSVQGIYKTADVLVHDPKSLLCTNPINLLSRCHPQLFWCKLT